MGRPAATHPGRALTEKQDRFVRLIGQGVTNAEACRIVGINRRTGTRWRFERTMLNTAGEPVHFDALNRRQEVELMEAQVAVAPTQRPLPRRLRIAQPGDREPRPLLPKTRPPRYRHSTIVRYRSPTSTSRRTSSRTC
jgi:hypothetical protein